MYYHPTSPSRSASITGSHTEHSEGSSSVADEIGIRARLLVFENAVFSVFSDHIADKNGNEVPRYLSVVPKCLLADSIAGVAVLPMQEDKIGLIRVFRHPLGRWSWEAIKGHAEPGESTRDAAARELLEETGYQVAPDHFIDLGIIAPEAGVIQGRSHLFAGVLTATPRRGVTPELGHGEIVFFSQKDIHALIARGEIEDASTLVILLKKQLKQ